MEADISWRRIRKQKQKVNDDEISTTIYLLYRVNYTARIILK